MASREPVVEWPRCAAGGAVVIKISQTPDLLRIATAAISDRGSDHRERPSVHAQEPTG